MSILELQEMIGVGYFIFSQCDCIIGAFPVFRTYVGIQNSMFWHKIFNPNILFLQSTLSLYWLLIIFLPKCTECCSFNAIFCGNRQ